MLERTLDDWSGSMVVIYICHSVDLQMRIALILARIGLLSITRFQSPNHVYSVMSFFRLVVLGI